MHIHERKEKYASETECENSYLDFNEMATTHFYFVTNSIEENIFSLLLMRCDERASIESHTFSYNCRWRRSQKKKRFVFSSCEKNSPYQSAAHSWYCKPKVTVTYKKGHSSIRHTPIHIHWQCNTHAKYAPCMCVGDTKRQKENEWKTIRSAPTSHFLPALWRYEQICWIPFHVRVHLIKANKKWWIYICLYYIPFMRCNALKLMPERTRCQREKKENDANNPQQAVMTSTSHSPFIVVVAETSSAAHIYHCRVNRIENTLLHISFVYDDGFSFCVDSSIHMGLKSVKKRVDANRTESQQTHTHNLHTQPKIIKLYDDVASVAAVSSKSI